MKCEECGAEMEIRDCLGSYPSVVHEHAVGGLECLKAQLASANKHALLQSRLKDASSTIANGRLRTILELRNQLVEAKAVIEKLPKTADGVPVVGGDTVYFKRFQGTGIIYGHAETVAMEMECVDYDTDSWMPKVVHGLRVCYSTEQAALDANKDT